MPFHRLLMGRLLNQPLLATPDYVEVVFSALSERLDLEPMVSGEVLQSYRRPAKHMHFDEAAGVMVIPVVGGLVHRSEGLNPPSGMTGYTALHNVLMSEARSRDSNAIVLDVDSPGGEVAGLQELSEIVAQVSAIKPVYAVANGLMASAAFWLCSSATRVYATPHSNVGSVGVVVAHLDRSKEMEKKGQKVTLIYAGNQKVAGNSYEALPDDVRENVQARVDALYGDFVTHVATTRGLDESVVRKTEAGLFGPESALELGLIDGIATLGEVIRMASQTSRPGARAVNAKGTNMATERAAYTESDMAEARESAVNEARAGIEQRAAETARAAVIAEVASALADVFPNDPRAETFSEALKDGGSVAFATKMAKKMPASEASAPSTNATDRDVERIMSAVSPGISVESGATGEVLDPKAARRLEIKGTMKLLRSGAAVVSR